VYHPGVLQPGAEVDLGEQAAHHLLRVLRVREGEPLTVFDGSGGEWRALITTVARGVVRVRPTEFDPVDRESPLDITLGQVISSGDRMDFTVQKSVELGVRCVRPLQSERGKVRLSGDRAERRVEHWRRVAEAACEQCGRNRVPEVQSIEPLLPWADVCPKTSLRLLLTPHRGEALSALAKPEGPVVLVAGAEGGLAEDEEEFVLSRGFQPVRLGPRVLRTETAAVAALAAMQALWGDL